MHCDNFPPSIGKRVFLLEKKHCNFSFRTPFYSLITPPSKFIPVSFSPGHFHAPEDVLRDLFFPKVENYCFSAPTFALFLHKTPQALKFPRPTASKHWRSERRRRRTEDFPCCEGKISESRRERKVRFFSLDFGEENVRFSLARDGQKVWKVINGVLKLSFFV